MPTGKRKLILTPSIDFAKKIHYAFRMAECYGSILANVTKDPWTHKDIAITAPVCFEPTCGYNPACGYKPVNEAIETVHSSPEEASRAAAGRAIQGIPKCRRGEVAPRGKS